MKNFFRDLCWETALKQYLKVVRSLEKPLSKHLSKLKKQTSILKWLSIPYTVVVANVEKH